MDNNMNQNNNDFYDNGEKTIFQFQPSGSNNNQNNNYGNQNNGENIYQFHVQSQQSQNMGDPFGVANNNLVFEQGIMNESIIDKIYKTPVGLLIATGLSGAIVLLGIVLIIIGASDNDKSALSFVGIMLAAMGGSLLAVVLIQLLNNKKMTKYISRDEIREEFKIPHYYLIPAKTYFTENYVISLSGNRVVAKYNDIVWAKEEVKTQQGGLIGAAISYKMGNTNILLILRNKKKYRFSSCNQINGIYTILTRKNNNIIVGNSREAKDAYKQIKNGYDVNNQQYIQQSNNLNQNNMYNNNNMNDNGMQDNNYQNRNY